MNAKTLRKYAEALFGAALTGTAESLDPHELEGEVARLTAERDDARLDAANVYDRLMTDIDKRRGTYEAEVARLTSERDGARTELRAEVSAALDQRDTARERCFELADEVARLTEALAAAERKAESWERGHDYAWELKVTAEAQVARLKEALAAAERLRDSHYAAHVDAEQRAKAAEQKLAAAERDLKQALEEIDMLRRHGMDRAEAAEARVRKLEAQRTYVSQGGHWCARSEQLESELAQLRERVEKAIRESGPPNATWDVAGPRMLEALRNGQ